MNYWLSFFIILLHLQHCTADLIDYEYHILNEFYNTTNGDSWTFEEDIATYGNKWNFNGSSDPCNNNWQGITCQSVEGINYIQNISLPQYNLNGPLIESMGNFKYLYYLHLGLNSLHGALPRNLANSSSLVFLRLHDNKFHGQIPAEYGNFSSLINMWFDRNQLTGTIPSEIANLPKAAWIDFGFNKITGKLPESLATMKALNNFEVNFNYLTGTIPEVLGNLINLYEFQVDTNYLTGTIPPSFGNLTKLIHLYLDTNLLYGTIPKSFSQLKTLKLLSIGHNQLTGSFPDVFGEMDSLQYLLSENNYFSGPLSESLYNLRYLNMIDFHRNLLTGSILSSIGNLQNLNQLQIAHNSFTGVIPEEVGSMESLKFLFVYYNLLTGSIPTSLVTLPVIQELNVYNNMLTGSIPSAISTASNLVSLLVHHNKLTGHLQDCFNSTTQTKLKTIQLSSNRFQGNIPTSLFLIKSLEVVDLTENCFKGSLPRTICESSNLISVYAEGLQSASNCDKDDMADSYIVKYPISNDIPECIFNLTNLMVLYLSGNTLTGSLSDSLELGSSLSWLSLAHNQLTGNIPKSIQIRRWTKLDLSHNRFSGVLKSNFASEPTDFTLKNPFPNLLQSYIASFEQNLLSYNVLNLQSNRLSGDIPSSFSRNTRNITNLQILRNNLFTCDDEDRNDLPSDDPDSDQYECGSQSFNAAYYTWVVGGFLLILGTILISYNCITTQTQLYLKQFDQFNSNEFSKICRSLQYISFWSTLYVLIILLPLYVILRHFYTTHRYTYAWSVSSAYLTSGAAAGTILTFVTIFMIAFVLLGTYYIPKIPISSMKMEGSSLLIRIILFLIGLGTSIGMNILFIYLIIYKEGSLTSLFQFLLALYLIFWNDYVYPKIINLFASYEKISADVSSTKYRLSLTLGSLQVTMQLFQYIIIPCIIVSVMSDNCFYNVFSSESQVNTKSYVLTCFKVLEYFYFTFSKTGVCLYIPTEFDNSYIPSFNYSYQCSASILVYYVPVFIYICIIVTFIIPLVHLLCYQLLPNGMFYYILLPNIFTRKDLIITDRNQLKLKSYEYFFHPNQLIISILGYLSILLTFGVMYPPLAIAILLMIISLITCFKLKTSRFIVDAIDQKATFYIDIFNEECDGMLQHLMIDKVILWVYVLISFLFYILFIFDTDGDEVGINGAYWILILVPLLTLVLYIIHFFMMKAGILPIEIIPENNNPTTTIIASTTNELQLAPKSTTDYQMSSVVKSPLAT